MVVLTNKFMVELLFSVRIVVKFGFDEGGTKHSEAPPAVILSGANATVRRLRSRTLP